MRQLAVPGPTRVALRRLIAFGYRRSGIPGVYGCLQWLVWGRSPRMILMYHEISESPDGGLPVAEFQRHLEFLQRTCRVVPLLRLVEAIQEREETGALVSLTFDDAYESFARYAYPLLKQANLSATLFVPTGYVGGLRGWDVPRGYRPVRLMSYEDLRKLNAGLVTIGSHGVWHRRLVDLDDAGLAEEVARSRVELEQELGREVRIFAYPYGEPGDYDGRAIRLLSQNGYVAACSSRWGRFNSVRDLLQLKRIGIRPEDRMSDFVMKLLGGYDWMAAKQRVWRSNVDQHVCPGLL